MGPSPKRHHRRGIALVTAVLTMVTIAALVAGSFFVGRIEQLTGINTVWATQAAEAAEAGVAHAMGTVTPASYQAMQIWTSSASAEMALPTVTAGSIAYTDTIRRLTPSLFMVRSTGRRLGAGNTVLAEAAVSQLMRIARPTVGTNAAVTVADPVTFNGNAFVISGENSYPPGWGASDCPSGGPDPYSGLDDQVAVRSATSTGAAPKDMDNLDGFPVDTASYDATVTSKTFTDFKDFTYSSLTALAGVKTLPLTTPYNGILPVLAGDGTCDKNAPLNLGEPLRGAGSVAACTSYYPIVHGTGTDTKFAAGSRGQGTLLIEGNLELVGGFEWTGLILVRGQIKISGNGNKIYGALLSEGMDVNAAGAIGGNIEIHYSKCAIDNATGATAEIRPVVRGWSQLY